MAISILSGLVNGEGASAFGRGAAWFGDTPPSDPVRYPDWYKFGGSHFVWDGTAWFQPPGLPGPGGSTSGKKPQLWM